MFKDLVKANRSCRGYDETYRMTKEELLDFVDHARLTPSGINAQPFKYYLAWKQDQVQQILPHTKWAGLLSHLKLPHEGMNPTGFIVICQDLNIQKSLVKHQKDMGVVAQTILLAATEKKLGGCIINNISATSLKKALELDEHLMPVLVIALGKPQEKVILTEVENGGSTKYYRDEFDVHYVPKRKLEDIII